ncbi:cell division protein ZapA [Erythrobacter sp. YT30]|uniref:cell division protein ZapA n=1 Tax=Erythrobacter sp. YT30 TaxID=1735012 RepID=UPI00076DB321|nr:cell division protein ZapA [Erythrobacter sp. YT30]KWV92804.1 hypothetical protein AUC45_01230 [Erythrobacter sp. YT30]
MSTVQVTIGPRTYPVECADGEEEHIQKLADLIDQKYAQLGEARAPQETQNLVFAALFLADELSEARGATGSKDADTPKPSGKKAELKAEIEKLRDENAALQAEVAKVSEAAKSPGDLFSTDQGDDAELAAKLEALAARAEAAADALEAAASDA